MATLRSAHKRRQTYKTTWAYRKKRPEYRALQLILEIIYPENIVLKEISDGGKLEPFTLPKGKYEARIVPHPDPNKARDRDKRWVVVHHGKKIVGISKGYLQSIQGKGWAKFYVQRTKPENDDFQAKAAPQVVSRA